jgi:MFS family permease
MAGPLLASAVLLFTSNLRVVFAAAAVPAVLAVVVLVFGVREEGPLAHAASPLAADADAPLGSGFRRYLVVLAVFTLGNSSDAFLLLRAQETGLTLALVPLLWAWHHLVKAGTSTWGGSLSDRLGRKKVILLGWTLYGLSYAGFAVARAPLQIVGLFAVYGLFHALTEGPERALVADLAGPSARGRAFGLFHAVSGAALLPASLLTGLLWQRYGAATALGVGAALAATAAAGLHLAVPEPHPARRV